jgi:hypothetical protein
VKGIDWAYIVTCLREDECDDWEGRRLYIHVMNLITKGIPTDRRMAFVIGDWAYGNDDE